MFDKENLKNLDSVINDDSHDYINNYDYNSNEYWRKNIEENCLDRYFDIKYFREEINIIKDSQHKMKDLFKKIVEHKCYNLASFLIERTDIDAGELFDLFVEVEDIEKLLKSKYPRNLLGFEILINHISKSGNYDLLEHYLEDDEIFSNICILFKSKLIGNHLDIVDFIIKKVKLSSNKKIINNIISITKNRDDLILFEKLYDNIIENEILKDENYINSLLDDVFSKKSINIIDFLFEKLDIKLDLLDTKYKLFLLEYFSKNDTPKSLKEKVIYELFKKNNSKYYECDGINCKDNNFFYIRNLIGNEPNGYNQVGINRIFEYDEENNSIYLKSDFAFSRTNGRRGELLYKVEYLDDGSKNIVYYESGSGGKIPLTKAKIDASNRIVFELDDAIKKYDLETFKYKVNEIVDSDDIKYFDDDLSNLSYAILKFQQHNFKDFSFILDCDNIYDVADVIQDSLREENTKKIYICNFDYKGHNTQIIVCKGKATIINTLDSNTSPQLKNELGVSEIIKRNCNNKDVEIKELYILNQSKNACVIASKIYTISLIMDYLEDFGNPLEMVEKLNKFLNLFETIADKNRQEQIEFINSNLSENEYNEYFNIMVSISKVNSKLLEKIKYFEITQDKFKKFRNSLISSKYGIELSNQENQIVKRSMIYSKFLDPFMKNDFFDFIHILGVPYDRFSNIPFPVVDKLIRDIESNKIEYVEINPISNKTFKLSYKMNCFLTAIKMGNYDAIGYYLKELEKYVKGDENLIKDNLENVIETHFKVENNPYISIVTDIFKEKINQVEQRIQNKDSNISSDVSDNIIEIEKIAKSLQDSKSKQDFNDKKEDLYKQNMLLTTTKNSTNDFDEKSLIEQLLDQSVQKIFYKPL